MFLFSMALQEHFISMGSEVDNAADIPCYVRVHNSGNFSTAVSELPFQGSYTDIAFCIIELPKGISTATRHSPHKCLFTPDPAI